MADEKQSAPTPQFGIQQVYVKDTSLESPLSPQVFLEKYEPKIHVDIQTKHTQLDEQHVEVVVHGTITAKQEDQTVFLVEVQQAGVFRVEGFPEAELPQVISVICPNILFPYLREACSDLIKRGGFPPVYLSPVNFDALYAQKMAEQQESKSH